MRKDRPTLTWRMGNYWIWPGVPAGIANRVPWINLWMIPVDAIALDEQGSDQPNTVGDGISSPRHTQPGRCLRANNSTFDVCVPANRSILS